MEQVNLALPARKKAPAPDGTAFVGRPGGILPGWQRGGELRGAVPALGHAGRHGHGDAFPKSCSLAGAEAAPAGGSG